MTAKKTESAYKILKTLQAKARKQMKEIEKIKAKTKKKTTKKKTVKKKTTKKAPAKPRKKTATARKKPATRARKKTGIKPKLIKSKKYYPPRQVYLKDSPSANIVGNNLEITYQIGRVKYKHRFNKKTILIAPDGKHHLIIYDPGGRMYYEPTRGIIG